MNNAQATNLIWDAEIYIQMSDWDRKRIGTQKKKKKLHRMSKTKSPVYITQNSNAGRLKT